LPSLSFTNKELEKADAIIKQRERGGCKAIVRDTKKGRALSRGRMQRSCNILVYKAWILVMT